MANIHNPSPKEWLKTLDSFNTSGKSSFDIWWEREGKEKRGETSITDALLMNVRELCRTAWENGADKAKIRKENHE